MAGAWARSLALALGLPLSAAGAAEPIDVPLRSAAAPRIDGRLDDDFWAGVEPITAFLQAGPTAGAEPTRRTELRLAHDGALLYVGVRAVEPEPAAIVARTLRRDAESIESEDHLALVLDPQGSGRNGFVFRVNALGAQRDGLVSDGGLARPEWDALWQAAAQVDEAGWTAEFALPLSALAAPTDGRPWGFNAERFVAASGERLRLFAAEPQRKIESLNDIGALTGVLPSRSGWGLRLQPALRWVAQRRADGDRREGFEPSLDAQYSVTPTLTAALTVNTDFSETDLDDQDMSLSRFELFRPEKRSFFTQDSGRFSFGGLDGDDPLLLPFFSRRIGLATALDAGVKVSGTAGPVELGAFGVQADALGQTGKARMGVVRAATAVGAAQRVGMIATQGRPDGEDGSRLVGADYQFLSTDVFDGRTLEAYAWTQRSTNAGLGSGAAHGASLQFPNVGLTGAVLWQHIDEAFWPALGFVREAGVRRAEAELGWWHRTDDGGDLIPRIYAGGRERLDGSEDSGYLGTGVEAKNARGDFLVAELFAERERVAAPFELLPGVQVRAGDHHYRYAALALGLAASHELSGELGLQAGGFYDGSLRELELKLAWRPSAHWTLSGGYNHQAVRLGGGRFDAKAASLRLDHASDTRSAQSLVVQRDNVSGQTVVGLRARWAWAPGREWRLAYDRLHPVREAAEIGSRLTLALVWALER